MAITNLHELPLETVEEACGELHRRLGVAMRRIGESGADMPTGPVGADHHTPRWEVGALVCAFELGIATFAAAIDGSTPPGGRTDRSRASVAATLYGAPRLPGLLARLDQDRRTLIALARRLGERLDAPVPTPWGAQPPRLLLIHLAIEESARLAQAMETLAEHPLDPPIV